MTASNVRPLPIVKWPGGKRSLIDRIIDVCPAFCGRYYEPFVGGGALFFALQPSSSVLSDTNADLINLYQQIRDCPVDLVRVLKTLRNSEDDYYEIRSSRPRSLTRRAARTLFLSTLAFNGIHRVNLKGEFNVPYGQKTHLPVFNEEEILRASKALRGAELLVLDFQQATSTADVGDLVYFDPPYTVAHGANGFVKYNEKIFSWSDQERLASHARALADRGCHVVVSNAEHKTIRALYETFEHVKISRFSRIAAASDHRKVISESLFFRKAKQ